MAVRTARSVSWVLSQSSLTLGQYQPVSVLMLSAILSSTSRAPWRDSECSQTHVETLMATQGRPSAHKFDGAPVRRGCCKDNPSRNRDRNASRNRDCRQSRYVLSYVDRDLASQPGLPPQ